MCDYSLMHVASRSAKVGDKLVSTQFQNASTRGFAAVGEPGVAVCLLPGTELAFDAKVATARLPTYCDDAQALPRIVIDHTVARFRQLHKDEKLRHHDALEFPDGQTVMLHDLEPGQTATVLQLPAAPKTEAEAEEQQRLEVFV
jgi:hypothetical protein